MSTKKKENPIRIPESMVTKLQILLLNMCFGDEKIMKRLSEESKHILKRFEMEFLPDLRRCPFCDCDGAWSDDREVINCPNPECRIHELFMTAEEWNGEN